MQMRFVAAAVAVDDVAGVDVAAVDVAALHLTSIRHVGCALI